MMDVGRAGGAASRNFHGLDIVLSAVRILPYFFTTLQRKFSPLLRNTRGEAAAWPNCDSFL